ncbi:MAG: hypothetical protein ACOCZ8_05975 [Bacteroidota bacterium]
MYRFSTMLRTLTIYCLVAAYGVLGLRSLVPSLSYELNFRYFSEEACVNKALPICCQGACQLKKMATETEDGESENGQQQPPETERTNTLVHLEAFASTHHWQHAGDNAQPLAHYFARLISRAPPVDTPPPRA